MQVFRSRKYRQYSISYKKSYSILDIAKLFKCKIKFIQYRKGERYGSSVIKKIKGNKIVNLQAKKDIKDYIDSFINKKLTIIKT